MRQIELPKKDFDFLKELAHELNTQPNDGNADPVYWGVMETKEVGVPDGCGDPILYMGDGCTMELEEAVEYAQQYVKYDIETEKYDERWEELDKSSMSEFVEFCHDVLDWGDVRIVYVEKKSSLSRTTGAFLTKRACQDYIKNFGYNHSKPHTYAMTAFRNYELERLLKILKSIDFKEE